ncbi:MAG: hypothetical protein JW867_03965 [Candidatus Omnitrophica bacterium]|nr:hypothetical protein [Candidatus Omnitrophota bacterium]
MEIIIFLLMNAAVVGSAYLITYKVIKPRGYIDSLISAFIFYISLIIATELVLGVLGILYLLNLILFNLLVFLLIWFLSSRKKALSFPDNNKKIKELFQSNTVIFLAILILVPGLIKTYINLISPTFGWDCLNYHFTFPVEWLKNANLNNPIVVSDDPFPSYYPINGSLYFLWLIFPFRSDFIADIGQLPFFIISFLALFSISRKLGLSRLYAFIAAALLVAMPNFFKQLRFGYIDIMVGGLFFAGANFLLSLKEDFSLNYIVLFSLSLGILIGTKTTALAYCVFLIVPFLLILLFQAKLNLKHKLFGLLLFLVLIGCFGGYSFIRNFLQAGNPFYPLKLTIMGKEIFKGVIDRATFTSRNQEGGYSLSKLLFSEGLGPQALLFIIPGLVLSLPVKIIKEKSRDIFYNYFMILPLILYFVYRYILPLPNSRYLYPMLGLGMIAGIYTCYKIKIPKKAVLTFSVISALACLSSFGKRLELVADIVSVLSLFALVVFIKKKKGLFFLNISRRQAYVCLFIFIIFLGLINVYYIKNEYPRYVLMQDYSGYWPEAVKAWAWLNKNTDGNNISYIGKPVPYPLYGTKYKNNVYYTSVNSIDPIHLHDLMDSEYQWDRAESMHINFRQDNNYRGRADYKIWLKNLRCRKTDFLFIYSLQHTDELLFPVEYYWAKDHPGVFEMVFEERDGNSAVKIYKIKK